MLARTPAFAIGYSVSLYEAKSVTEVWAKRQVTQDENKHKQVNRYMASPLGGYLYESKGREEGCEKPKHRGQCCPEGYILHPFIQSARSIDIVAASRVILNVSPHVARARDLLS